MSGESRETIPLIRSSFDVESPESSVEKIRRTRKENVSSDRFSFRLIQTEAMIWKNMALLRYNKFGVFFLLILSSLATLLFLIRFSILNSNDTSSLVQYGPFPVENLNVIPPCVVKDVFGNTDQRAKCETVIAYAPNDGDIEEIMGKFARNTGLDSVQNGMQGFKSNKELFNFVEQHPGRFGVALTFDPVQSPFFTPLPAWNLSNQIASYYCFFNQSSKELLPPVQLQLNLAIMQFYGGDDDISLSVEEKKQNGFRSTGTNILEAFQHYHRKLYQTIF